MENKLKKAKAELENKGITAVLENDTLYVKIDEVQLELAEFEINFQAKLYDERQEDDKN